MIINGINTKVNFLIAAAASSGIVLAAAYMLWLYKRIIFGKLKNTKLLTIPDLNKNEIFILWCLAIPSVYFGFYPDPLINTVEVSLNDLIEMYNNNINQTAKTF